ncbi:pyridoxamine 5'-phosphate oxidase family protein [Streptomyces atroolivaceus]|uniref:pyridoxamine 5'-phosphate oxidase family protein n=1 Tax=Streptomyces atroolivaceus TaxID=66869 RepID=UPI00379315DB
MTEREPARGPEQRKQDALDRLEKEDDAWVATASAHGVPCLVPLSFVWDGGTLLLATRRTNPTAVNVTPSGQARVTLGHTRDVVLIEGTAEIVEGADLSAESGDVFAAKLGWDPRGRPAWVYLRITPDTVKAWREENELSGRELMRGSTWLV